MYEKVRLLKDSKSRDRDRLIDTLTNNQHKTIEQLLNITYKGCKLYDPRNGGFYGKGMIPCTLNDLGKAIDKKVDKLFKVLSNKEKPIIKKVIDCRGRDVWMINPLLYWDNVTYELYYNRWLFSLGCHKDASKAVNISLVQGYWYDSETGDCLHKISDFHWQKMCKWWLITGNDCSIDLVDFKHYQPMDITASKAPTNDN